MRRFVLSMNTFIRQRLVTVQEVDADRAARKRIERKGKKVEPISIVQLRQTERKSSQPGESEPVEWSCSWTVAGHVRKQWYPTLGIHMPVIINPYIKGDLEKPLKPRSTPIYAVVR
jgi:hypothetical protein